MKIPLVSVGNKPPRHVRGRTLLPEGFISPLARWAIRFVTVALMAVLAPPSLLVALWWLWGLRKRMWRWYMPLGGVLTALVVFVASKGRTLAAGPIWWAHVIADTDAPNTLMLLGGGWVVGTAVGCWAAFLAWWRTPPWKDKARPKTWWAKRREAALVAALSNGEGDVHGAITFGIDTDTGEAVQLPWADTSGHMFVTGAPGTGKTTTAMKAVRASIRDEMFTAIVDMKGSPKIIEQVAGWCARWDRPLWVFTAEGPSRYDPFRHGDYNRKADLLMATSQWSEEHYKAKAGDYLRTVFYVLDILGEGGPAEVAGQKVAGAAKRNEWVRGTRSWLHTVAWMLDPNNFATAVAYLPELDHRTPEATARAARVLAEARDDMRALSGLGPRVRALTDTVLGQWVQPGEPFIDLLNIWERRGVVVFSLPTLTHPEAAAAFGGLAVQDLKTLAGTLQDRENTDPGLVFVDEFSTLGAHNITTALAMARESGLRWMIATQDLGDLAVGEDGRAFVQKVLTDTTVKIIHGIGDPETAERLAQLAGTRWGYSERTAVNQSDSAIDITSGTQSGHGFVDVKLVPVIEPNDILHQGAGAESQFTLINKTGQYAISHAHTVIDSSTWAGELGTAPQHVPARYRIGPAPTPLAEINPAAVSAPTPAAPATGSVAADGWWD